MSVIVGVLVFGFLSSSFAFPLIPSKQKVAPCLSGLTDSEINLVQSLDPVVMDPLCCTETNNSEKYGCLSQKYSDLTRLQSWLSKTFDKSISDLLSVCTGGTPAFQGFQGCGFPGYSSVSGITSDVVSKAISAVRCNLGVVDTQINGYMLKPMEFVKTCPK